MCRNKTLFITKMPILLSLLITLLCYSSYAMAEKIIKCKPHKISKSPLIKEIILPETKLNSKRISTRQPQKLIKKPHSQSNTLDPELLKILAALPQISPATAAKNIKFPPNHWHVITSENYCELNYQYNTKIKLVFSYDALHGEKSFLTINNHLLPMRFAAEIFFTSPKWNTLVDRHQWLLNLWSKKPKALSAVQSSQILHALGNGIYPIIRLPNSNFKLNTDFFNEAYFSYTKCCANLNYADLLL